MPQVDNDGVRIHFEIEGGNFPVVLHTGAGGDGRMWREAGYVDGLDEFQRILIDHRGHGQSDKPDGVENHRIERYVSDVIAVLDSLGHEHSAFWGYSSGSSVGFALAAAHPERVTGLIVSGSIGPHDHVEPEQRLETERRAAVVRQHGVGELIKPLEEAEGIVFPDWFWRQMVDTDGEAFALELLGAIEWRGPWSILQQIQCPILMLVGELEDPDGNNLRAASVLRDARCVTFQGLGHVGAFLRSDLALAEAAPFLQAICNAGGGT